MSFRLTQKPTFKAKVTVPVPNDKGGHDKETFVAVFKRKTTDEIAELRELSMTDAEFVREVLTDWELTDKDTNESVPFNSETLNALLAIQPVPKFTVLAFYENVTGGKG